MSKKNKHSYINKKDWKKLNKQAEKEISSVKSGDQSGYQFAINLGFSPSIARNIKSQKAAKKLLDVSKTNQSRSFGEIEYNRKVSISNTGGISVTSKGKIEKGTGLKEIKDYFNEKASEFNLNLFEKQDLKDDLNRQKKEDLRDPAFVEEILKFYQETAIERRHDQWKYVSKQMGGKEKTAGEIKDLFDDLSSAEQKMYIDQMVLKDKYNKFHFKKSYKKNAKHRVGFVYAHAITVMGLTEEQAKKYIKKQVLLYKGDLNAIDYVR
jgi:hypothetical protein